MTDPEALRDFQNMQGDPRTKRGTQGSIDIFGQTYGLANSEQRINRMRAGFYGRGDYRSAFKQFGHHALRGAGRWVGNYFGGPMGGELGHQAGAAISRWTGFGKYRKKRKNYKGRGDYGGDAGGNQIMAGSVETPMTVNASDDLSGDVFFNHREFLGNVQALVPAAGLSTFNVTTYPINVGLVGTFPWLSQIAENFELYDLQGCVFEYRPTSGELGSTSNQLGKVVMATNYDPDAPAFTSSVQMENYDYANACKPSEHMVHGIETDPKQRATQLLYVRTGASTKDRVFTDIGNFQIATEGIPVTGVPGTFQNIGELWVSYRVKLSRAQLFSSLLAGSIQVDDFFATASAANVMANTNTVLAGSTWASSYTPAIATTAAAPRMSNTLGGTLTSGSANGAVYSFPSNTVTGLYEFTVWVAIPANVATIFAAPTGTLATLRALPGIITAFGGTSNSLALPGATTSLVIQFYMEVNAPGSSIAQVTLGWTANLNNNTVWTLSVRQVPMRLL